MEHPIFSFGIKEQLMVMLQNVNDVGQNIVKANFLSYDSNITQVKL